MKQVLIYNDDNSEVIKAIAAAKGGSVLGGGAFVQAIPAIKKGIVKLGKEVFLQNVTADEWNKLAALDK